MESQIESVKALDAYRLRQVKHIPELNSDGMILEHKKTGANIFLMSNEDNNKVFCIGFRTPPSDSTGVPHIIEHIGNPCPLGCIHVAVDFEGDGWVLMADRKSVV